MRFQQTYEIGKSTLSIRLGDIASATTQVIVTSDDQRLTMGGGTSAAIRRAAGESVYEASRALVPVPLGGVVSTPAGKLAQQGVQHIFHAATIPGADEKSGAHQDEIVRGATAQAIALLRAMRLQSIALPALGTGFAKFDAHTVALAMAEAIRTILASSADALTVEIWLLLGTTRDLDAVTFLSEFTERANLAACALPSHAVVLVHGIRTAAGWRERIGNEIESADSTLTPIQVGYGLFDLVRFLLPIGPWRRRAAETVWMKMRSVFDNPNFDRVSIVAHSFGTWIVGYLLTTKDVRFHRVIFCGSILDSDFNWEKVQHKTGDPTFQNAPHARVVNDCGIRDVWPIVAKSATWGYGVSGRWGFQNALVKDRFHDLDHSGFFADGFATRYWVPALTGTKLPRGIEYGISPPAWLSLLTVVKLPYLLIGLGLAVYFLS